MELRSPYQTRARAVAHGGARGNVTLPAIHTPAMEKMANFDPSNAPTSALTPAGTLKLQPCIFNTRVNAKTGARHVSHLP
jgi:hypothetical protein